MLAREQGFDMDFMMMTGNNNGDDINELQQVRSHPESTKIASGLKKQLLFFESLEDEGKNRSANVSLPCFLI